MASIVFNNVSKTFKDTAIIKNVNLTINDGECTVLIGPSGCGKSTMLRLICGLEEHDEGDIYIGDRLVNNVPPANRGIAMVFQSYALYPHMTVFENMAFALRVRNLKKSEIEERVVNAAKILKIDHLLQRRPKELSGGQRQRVAIGRAIVRNPYAFLFDEPLSNLDTALRYKMRYELAKLKAQLKTTMVYVTHDQSEAMTLADKIVVMRDGIIEQVGKPLEIYDSPANLFVAKFLGTGEMNVLPVHFIEFLDKLAVFELPTGERISFRRRKDNDYNINDEYYVGIRPEDIEILNPNATYFGNQMSGQISLFENLGGDGFVHLNLKDDTPIMSKTRRIITEKDGSDVKLCFGIDRCYLFDKDGKTLLGINRKS
jgi:ABC-type sugar transport system ATPase subunit